MPAPLPEVGERAASNRLKFERRPDIQGLRAVAVLMVVAFHAGLPVPGGFVGVDVFFVISGFVITAMLHREWHQTGRIRFGRFYLRRFKRLTPALALMVVVTMVLSLLLLSPLGPQQTAAKTAIGAMLLAANFVIARTVGGYFDAPAETNPLLNTWSLSVEEQFYLAFPGIIALGWILARRGNLLRVSPIVIVAGVGISSFALALAGSRGLVFRDSGALFSFYSPFTRAWEFAAGALLALVIAKRTLHASRLLTSSGLVGAGMLAASLWLIGDTTPFPGLWTLLPVTGTLLLIVAGSHREASIPRALSIYPMVKIGDWSYSIYLWHWPFIVFAGLLWPERPLLMLASALASVLPAVASYRWLEEPIRSLPPLSRPRTVALLVGVMLPPILISSSVLLVSNKWLAPGFLSGQLGGVVHPGDVGQDDFHAFVQARYHPCTPEEIRKHALYWDGYLRCQQSLAQGPVKVALVGDSHAEHLFLGLAESAPSTNIAYYILGELPVRSAGDDMARILDHVTQDPDIRAVILSAFWAGRGVPEPELVDTIERLQGAGKDVFVADGIPGFPFDPVQCRNRTTLLFGNTRCEIEIRGNAEVYAKLIGPLRSVVSSVPGVELLQTNRYFCGVDSCSMTDGYKLLYRDALHLNMNGTRFLADHLIADYPNLRAALQR